LNHPLRFGLRASDGKVAGKWPSGKTDKTVTTPALSLIDRAVLLRICGYQFSDVLENLLPRRGAGFVTGLTQFGTPERGHLSRTIPVSQEENTGCLLGHVRLARV
jgi:hypothetical protein